MKDTIRKFDIQMIFSDIKFAKENDKQWEEYVRNICN
jgi:hypothetical protein